MSLTYQQAAKLVEVTEGPAIAIRISLIKQLNLGLAAAAFVSQAAWLSKNASIKDEDDEEKGWFFLEQEGEGDKKKDGLYKELGSWESALGLSKKEQENIRRRLIEAGHLFEMPTESARRRGESGLGCRETAFLFTQRRGTPPRLFYKVDLVKYIKFLMSAK